MPSKGIGWERLQPRQSAYGAAAEAVSQECWAAAGL